MKASDYVSIVKEIYKLCFDANKEKEIRFLTNNIKTLSLVHDSNDIGTMRNYLTREIFSLNTNYETKTILVREIYNYDIVRLQAELTAMANALYNKILYLQNLQPNTSSLEIAELVLKLTNQ